MASDAGSYYRGYMKGVPEVYARYMTARQDGVPTRPPAPARRIPAMSGIQVG
jgi:hypothetical protein